MYMLKGKHNLALEYFEDAAKVLESWPSESIKIIEINIEICGAVF